MAKVTIKTIAMLISFVPVMAMADEYHFSPGDACVAPVRPVGNSDPGAISHYQAQRQKFMECVQKEDKSSPTYQSDLDQSLGMIGDDQLEQTDIIQQEAPHPLGHRH